MDEQSREYQYLQRWQSNRSVLEIEITVGHVWMQFTGRITHLRATEMVMAHESGELSISLFCANANLIEPSGQVNHKSWKQFASVMQIETDGGANCTIQDRLG